MDALQHLVFRKLDTKNTTQPTVVLAATRSTGIEILMVGTSVPVRRCSNFGEVEVAVPPVTGILCYWQVGTIEVVAFTC